MGESRTAKQRKFQELCGSPEIVKVEVRITPSGGMAIYKASCLLCSVDPLHPLDRVTYRAGKSNSFKSAVHRWVLHLNKLHPEVDAPCLAFLAEARAELSARKNAEAQERHEFAQMLKRWPLPGDVRPEPGPEPA